MGQPGADGEFTVGLPGLPGEPGDLGDIGLAGELINEHGNQIREPPQHHVTKGPKGFKGAVGGWGERGSYGKRGDRGAQVNNKHKPTWHTKFQTPLS